jgi:lactaldehyde dehydrogenase / glycolaldehyde dehydrogenase
MKQYEQFIDGAFVPNGDRKMIPVLNPSTEEVLSQIPAGTRVTKRS